MSVDRAILIVPYGHDPLDALAAHLLATHEHEFPDLTRHAVILPRRSVRRFEQILLRGTEALLPPSIGDLETWLQRYLPSQPHLSNPQQELQFFDILKAYPALTTRYGTWSLIDGLFALFNEITLNACELPATVSEFEKWLASAYGLSPAHRLTTLSDEAHLVYSLYRAWYAYLAEQHRLEPVSRQLAAMRASLDDAQTENRIYIAGVLDWPRTWLNWLAQLPHPLTLVIQGEPGAHGDHPNSPVTKIVDALGWPTQTIAAPRERTLYVDAIFANDTDPMMQRARQARDQLAHDPFANYLSVFCARDAETEAHAIELQVRRWWLNGIRNIGIVGNDRKLLRRVRALLERAQLPALDRSGWPLSTTSAASCVMDWLSCVSTEFSSEAVLDFLRSPFSTTFDDLPSRQNALAAIEKVMLSTRNYRGGLEVCAKLLEHHEPELKQRFGSEALANAHEIIARLRTGAMALAELKQRRSVSLSRFCRALNTSLQTLGVIEAYSDDEAGNQLLALLDELTICATTVPTETSWDECVQWLRRALEHRHFVPPAGPVGVELMGFSDASLSHYEALVLASCTADHLPARDESSPFFNDAVRAELGLRRRADLRNVQFNTFRRLLEAADNVLLTYRQQDANRPLAISPWIERMQAFHSISFSSRMTDPVLEEGVADPRTQLSILDRARPAPAVPPSPVVPTELRPTRISASMYQSLVDCPYQFYTRAVLGLEPPRPLAEELTPADYGQLVHRCLQAFHDDVNGLPGPWQGPLIPNRLAEASQLLQQIAEAVFATHLRRTITTRAWLYRWQREGRAYVTWQSARQRSWPVTHCEQPAEHTLTTGHGSVQLYGRVDRIDESGISRAIIDYKTGLLPKRVDVQQGEHVQLPFYALLASADQEARFLGFGDSINDRIVLTDTDLRSLVDQHVQRLICLFDDIARHAPLPAHGDPETCARCTVATLCRRPLWPSMAQRITGIPHSHHG